MTKPLIIALSLLVQTLCAQQTKLPAYSGKVEWDADTSTCKFQSSGSMPAGKEDFFWEVPLSVKRIWIAGNVTVRGGFRVLFRPQDNPLHIQGADQDTSVILGTEENGWTMKNDVPDNEKWKYGSVSVLADATVHISQLSSLNPRGYHVSGYANRSVIHLSHCKLIDRRTGHNNNSDGFIGAAGSSITDCFISTGDDAIKVYQDMSIRNVVIEHHRNGAPIQFGWGGKDGRAQAAMENVTIKGVSPDGLYNMAPFTWEAGNGGICDVTVRGLVIESEGKVFDEENKAWLPMGLFELKPRSCTLNMKIAKLDAGPLGSGIRHTAGIISVDGKPLK